MEITLNQRKNEHRGSNNRTRNRTRNKNNGYKQNTKFKKRSGFTISLIIEFNGLDTPDGSI